MVDDEQSAHPIRDITTIAFVDQGAATVSLYAALDEAVMDDTDYITTPDSPTGSVYVTKLTAIDDPVASDGHLLQYAYRKSAVGGEALDLTVELRQGYQSEGARGALITSFAHVDIPGVTETFSAYLDEAEADLITNYADLYLRFAIAETP